MDNHKSPQQNQISQTFSLSRLSSFSRRQSHYIILAICVTLFFLLQIPYIIKTSSTSSSTSPSSSWSSSITSYIHIDSCKDITFSMIDKLRDAITFLPLKDLRYDKAPLKDHTWFMSYINDTHDEGDVTYQHYPSKTSKDRILCVKGRNIHDGSWNYYAFAWEEALPYNATLLKGLTFVSYNHYSYESLWHGLSSFHPLVGWYMKNKCSKTPSRWVLYHKGELRTKISNWLSLLMEATFGEVVHIERFDGVEDDQPICFEEAVVTRHSEGGMSRDRRNQVLDLLRCKARAFCNVTLDSQQRLNETVMTLLMRTGPRSFKNESAVIDIFRSECDKVRNCRLMVSHSDNLTFCQQVELMSLTDILISPHGAQLTNMFFMDKNSSVMEFYPKGWLELAGVGQYVYRWLTSWSGMKHQGAYRHPEADHCPFPENDRRCMTIFKQSKIGHNETYFREWVRNVTGDVKLRKIRLNETYEDKISHMLSTKSVGCTCEL